MIREPYLTPLINHLNRLSNGSQIIATSISHAVPNGPNFVDNIFRSTVVQVGIPKIERIPYQDVDSNQTY